MQKYIRFVVEHPFLTILLILAITIFMGAKIPHLRFESSIYDLTIEDLPENIDYQAFKKEFGSEELILVAAKSRDLFDPAVFERLDRLHGRLAEVEGINRVISLPGIKKEIDLAGDMTLPEFEQIISSVDLFRKCLISENKKTAAFTLILDDVQDKEPIIESVQAIIDEERDALAPYQIGLPLVAQALTRFTENDFCSLPFITFAVISVALLFLFRSLRCLVGPAATLLTALIWTFGLMAWTDTPLSLLTMIVPIFLIAVGTAYCMHVVSECRRLATQSGSPAEAAFQGVYRLAFPTALAVITTSIGLCSLLVNKINAIREFAVFSCVGILSVLVLIFTLMPALLALIPVSKRRVHQAPVREDFFDRLLAKIININIHRQKITLPIIGLITLVVAAGVLFINVESNPIEYFKQGTSISRHFRDIYRDLSGSIPLNVTVSSPDEKFFQDPANLKMIERMQQYISTLDGVDKTESYADYLKLVNFASNQYQKEFYTLPEEDFEVRILTNNFQTILGQDLFRRFMNPEFSRTNIVLRTHISSSRDCLQTEEKILDYVDNNFSKDLEVDVTGFGLVMAHSSHILTKGQVRSLSLNLALIFGIMFFLFLSVKVGLIAMAPNLFPIIMNFGLMGWLGMELSAVTSLIASVAIGLAVDDTIHYLFRYNREFKKDLNKQRALKRTIEHVGRPILFTTITISLGFAVLLFSSFKPTTVFGLMMVITMFSALVGDLFLLPALMQHVELVTIWDLLRLKLGKDPQEGIPLFQGMSRSQVHYALMAGALRKMDPSDVLFHKGETSDSMYAVISGTVDVLDHLEDGTEDESGETSGLDLLIARLQAGDLVGEMGLVRSCRRTATVIARSPVELLEVNRDMLKRLTWLYPPTAHRFFFNLMTILSDRLEYTTACLSETATVDALTGLYYPSYFTEELEMEMYRAGRYRHPLCLLLAELDNYQAICEEHGNKAGEWVLAEIGKIMLDELRASDKACRWGENQFAVLLINTPKEKARIACNRLWEIISDREFKSDSRSFRVAAGFSLIAVSPHSKATRTDLLKMASKALGQAKKSGVSEVIKFEDEI